MLRIFLKVLFICGVFKYWMTYRSKEFYHHGHHHSNRPFSQDVFQLFPTWACPDVFKLLPSRAKCKTCEKQSRDPPVQTLDGFGPDATSCFSKGDLLLLKSLPLRLLQGGPEWCIVVLGEWIFQTKVYTFYRSWNAFWWKIFFKFTVSDPSRTEKLMISVEKKEWGQIVFLDSAWQKGVCIYSLCR